MNKNTAIILTLVLVVILGTAAYALMGPQRNDTDINITGEPVSENNDTNNNNGGNTASDKSNLIVLDNPKPNQIITSPLVIKGKARGNWFFEASFPVKLLGPNGQVLATHYATAQGEWMTEDFVPFESTITFTAPLGGTGTLVLEKDNPSGLPENDDSLRIPVRFSQNPTSNETTIIKVYFSSAKAASTDCRVVTPMTRIVPKTEAVARTAIQELLKGPTAEEASKGFSSAIPEGVVIQSLEIKNEIAFIDFNSALEKVGGSCRVSAIVSQIESTLEQFPTIKDVELSINGRSSDILQP